MSLLVVARFAFAILFDALAFVVWDVGTRPPLRLAHDVARGARVPRSLLRGVVRFFAGAGLLVLAGVDGEVTAKRGKHLFYRYVLTRAQAQAAHK